MAAIVLLNMLFGMDSVSVSQWYVAPDGKPTNRITEGSPWDIALTLDGKQKVTAGDTVYLLPGIYKRRPEELFGVSLVGTENQPIQLRPVPAGRATIDGGLEIQEPSAHVWLRAIEIMVSEPTPEPPPSQALTQAVSPVLGVDLTCMAGIIASISTLRYTLLSRD